jgi:hypothetical protein
MPAPARATTLAGLVLAEALLGSGGEERPMASMTAGETTCRRCGTDPLPRSVAYSGRFRGDRGEGIGAVVLRLCEPCSRDFESDEERDEYLRLGLLAA